ncbi:MAG: hypothetical protein ACYTGQ_06935 [Planctomycetota bacterium]|jgi:hypothetical protein
MGDVKNQYGRKGGRGIRPWLLIPKVLAVGCVVGGLVAMGVVSCWDDNNAVVLVGLILERVVGPGVTVAIVFGVGLFRQHAVVFWRMRWLRIKMFLVIVFLGSLLFLWDHVQVVAGGDQEALSALRWNLVVSIGMAVALVILGRMKPRLGMEVAKPGERVQV